MLVSELKLLLRFDSDSIFEDVSQTNMLKIGDSDISVLADSGGYQMKNDQYLFGDGLSSNGYSLDVSTNMSIGFWLYPVSPGLAINPGDSSPSSIEMPLCNFVDSGSSANSVIEITEHTSQSGNNYLQINLEEGKYIINSEEYAPLLWHHFWIVYNTTSITIFIDGKRNTNTSETGSISSIDGSFLDLYINHSVNGYGWNVAKNYGVIDDLTIFNISNTSESDIQRFINDGVLFISDDSNTSTYIFKSDIYFNDPTTITITSLIDDMSYIFVGRNDGKIMRGSPLLWEVRRDFSNSDEISILNLPPSSQKNGFLQLTNQTIRL
jgi:hypothetical protein